MTPDFDPHPLNYPQADFARRCVARWISVYHENHGRFPSPPDADHSGLLLWLFNGNDPLPEPPLKSGIQYGPWNLNTPADNEPGVSA